MKNLLQKTISTLCACAMLLSYIPAQVYADDPVEMPIENQMMIDEQPTEISQPEEELPAEEPQAEQQPAEEEQTAEQQQPSGEQSTEEQPQEEQPAEVQQSAEEQSVDEQPPAEDGPAEEQQSENQASIDQNEESQQPAAEQPVAEEQTAKQPAEEKQEEHPAPAEQSAETQKPEEKQPAEEHPAEDPAVIKQPAEPQRPETTQPEIKQPEEKPAGETPAESLPDYPTFEIGSGTSGTLYQGETTGLIAHAGKRGEVLFTLTLNLEPEEESTVSVTFNDDDVWLMRQDGNAHVYTFVRRFEWDERFVITLTAQKDTEYSLQSELLPEESEEQEETVQQEIPEQEPLTEGQTEGQDSNPEAETADNSEDSEDPAGADQEGNEQPTTETAEESEASSSEDAQEPTEPSGEANPENQPENEQETASETTEEAQPEEETEQPDPLVITGEVTEAGFFNGTMEYTGPDYKVMINIPEDAAIPAEATLAVREIPRGSEEYYTLAGATDELLSEDWNKIDGHARFFDICFVLDGEEIEPFVPVDVQIIFTDAITPTNEENTLKTVHIDDAGNAKIIESADTTEGASTFSADSFSIYGVVEVGTLTKTVSKAGRNYMIRVEYGQDTNIPEGSTLEVTEINPSAEAYDEYQRQAALAMNSDDAELLGLYDISIFHDGEKIRPEGEVKVSIRCTQSLDAEELRVVHFHEDDNGNNSVTAAISQNTEPETVSQSEVEVIDDLTVSSKTVTFQTEGFSVFAIAYTVDYTYENKEYHMQGSTSVLLSELFGILNIEADVRNISKVEFTDETLLRIDAEGEDYRLTSLKPFTSNETLTVVMNDGTVYVIAVTDEQTIQESSDLSKFLINATVTGATQQNGIYVVEKNKLYGMTLTFKENLQWQFKNNETLTYTIPDGLAIPQDQTTPMTIAVVSAGKTYEVGATLTVSTNGQLTIKFDESDPDYPRLANTNNVSLRASFKVEFNGSTETIKFSDSVEKKITIDNEDHSDAYAEKTGTFDEQTGTYTYTVKIKATGNPKNVHVKDVISGNALVFKNDVQITGNSSSYTTGTLSAGERGFDYTFAEMQDCEQITITYSASLDPNILKTADVITPDQTKNTVTVTKEGGESHNAEYSNYINFKTPQKSDGTEAGTTNEGNKLYNWSIEYNKLALVSAAEDTIKDTIDTASQQYMKYYEDVNIKVYDHNGTLVETRSFTPSSDSEWSYKVPNTDTTPYRYVFEYKTVVDQTKVDGAGTDLQLKNEAEGDGGKDWGGITIGSKDKVSISKSVESSSTSEITWISHIHVPENGLTQAVVTDTLPNVYFDNKYHYDKYKANSLVITGLLSGESYTDPDITEDGKIKITFYKDSEMAQEGLQGVAGGHDITVKLTTTVDQEYLQYGYENGTYFADHKNTIGINGTVAEATKTFAKAELKKTGKKNTDWQGNTSFLYTIVISDVSAEPLVIEDQFDTSILEVDTSNTDYQHFKVWGGNQYSQGNGQTAVNYSDTANGILITANSLPKESNGEFYSYYKICYYLKLKDGVDLEDLAVANGGEYNLINKAKTGELESDFTFTTKYDALSKEVISEATAANHYAKYKITFNPKKGTLNNGEAITLTDKMNANLSIDHSSVVIETDPAGAEVSYSFSGEKINGMSTGGTIGTYIIPDETSVTITYDAMVIGAAGSVTYSNEVEANGEKEIVTKNVEMSSSGGGQGSQLSIKAVKVDGYDASKKLSGIKFKLYSASDLSLYSNDHAKYGTKEEIIETDENGVLDISYEKYGFSLYENEKYYLEEIDPLPGYMRISFPYQFTLTEDMDSVNWDSYVYYTGETFQIKNWPMEGLIIEKSVVSDDEADKQKQFAFEVSILDENGEVDKTVNETYGDEMKFVNGVATFNLKDKEQISAWNMPAGTKFKVTERNEDGFVVSVSEGETTSNDATYVGKTNAGTFTLVTYTNTRSQSGSLKLLKTVAGLQNGDSPKDYYCFEVFGKNGLYYDKDANPSDSAVSIDVTSGSTGVTINDLPVQDYTITEVTGNENDAIDIIGYTVAVTGCEAPVTVTAGGTVTAEIKNTYTPTTVSVSATKVWKDNDNSENKRDAITFVISGTYTDSDNQTQSVTISNAEKDIPADASGDALTVSWTGLPEYINGHKVTYTVSERGVTNGIITFTDGTQYTVNVTSGDNNTFTITNTLTGEISVSGTKHWVDLDGRPNDLNIKLYKVDGTTETEVDLQSADSGVANYMQWDKTTDPKNWTYTITHVAKYDENGKRLVYKVKETSPSGYTATNTEATGKVNTETGDITEADFTNTKYGKIKVTKTVAINGDRSKIGLMDGPYYFGVFDSEGKQVQTTKTITITNGVSDPSGGVEFDELLPGYYTVKELASAEANAAVYNEAGVEVTGDGTQAVTLNGGEQTVDFVNTKFGKLQLTKTVVMSDNKTLSEAKDYFFTVSQDTSEGKLYYGRYENGNATPGTTDKQYIVLTVPANGTSDTVTIDKMPLGTYIIAEENNSTGQDPNLTGYKLAITGDGEVTVNDTTATKGITNTYTPYTGSLKIIKSLTGNGTLDTSKQYPFRVTLTPPAGTTLKENNVTFGGTTYTISENKCIATINVTNATPVTLTDIPYGWSYQVQELDGDAVLTVNGRNSEGTILKSVSGAQGTVDGTTDDALTVILLTDAVFTNEINEGAFKITKKLEGNDVASDANKEFDVTVTIKDADGNALSGEKQFKVNGTATVFTNGSKTIPIKADQTVTVSGIPNGYKYIISEADYSGNSYSAAQYQVGTEIVSGKAPEGTIIYFETPEIKITNTRNTYGSLEISKAIEGNAADTSKKFNFTITFLDKDGHTVDLNGAVPAVTYEETKIENKTVTENRITVSLGKGAKLKVANLPVGWTYKVEEDDYSDELYSTTAKKNTDNATDTRTVSGSVTASGDTVRTGSSDIIAYTNTKNDFGSLQIKKTSTGNAKNANDVFTVKVTLDPKPEDNSISFTDYNNTSHSFVNGEVTFPIIAGRTQLISGIPNDTTYIVEETERQEYDTTYSTLSGLDNSGINNQSTETIPTKFIGKIDIKENPTANEVSLRNVGVEITNNLDKYGDLELTKDVFNYDGDEGRFEFTVTISGGYTGGQIAIKDKNNNEINNSGSATTFSNGSAVIYLAKNEKAVMTHLPYGATYKILETTKQIYDSTDSTKLIAEYSGKVTKESAEGSIGDNTTVQVAFTNTRIAYGDLKIQKNVQGNAASLSDTFNFTIKLEKFVQEAGQSDKYVAYTFTDVQLTEYGLTPVNSEPGTFTATISADSPIVIPHLIAGSKYTITEETSGNTANGYILANGSSNPATGTIFSDTINLASFTNVKNLFGAFTLNKNTAGNDGDKKSWFAFKITLKDQNNQPVSGTFGNLTFDSNGIAETYKGASVTNYDSNTDGVAGYNVVISKNDTVKVWGLPNGTEYTIEEEPGAIRRDLYIQTTNGKETGTIEGYVSEADKDDESKYTDSTHSPISVVFTNTRDYNDGKVKILKETTGNAATDTEEFDIYIFITDKNGYEYSTDKYPLGDKNGTGGFINKIISGEHTGQFKITLHGGQSKIICNIPKWSKVSVTEPELKGYDSVEYSYTISGGTPRIVTENGETCAVVEEELITATVTNTKNRFGNLAVKKNIIGNAANENDEFDFTVKLTGDNVADSYFVVEADGTTKTITPTNQGIITFKLKGNETYEIRGIANGVAYEVTESTTAVRGDSTIDYTQVSKSSDRGTISGTYSSLEYAENTVSNVVVDPTTAVFTNNRDADGKLILKKTLSGNNTDSSKKFTFEIRLGEASDNEKITQSFPASGAGYTDVNFRDGVATVELDGGTNNKVTITGLPNGTKYTVTELSSSSAGYIATVSETTGTIGNGASASGYISETSDQSVTINNRKDTFGNLTINKTVTGKGGKTDKNFIFRITLTNRTTYGERLGNVQFENGVAYVTLNGATSNSETISGLPNGTEYIVEEVYQTASGTYEIVPSTGYDGYIPSYDSNATGTIVGDTTKITSITNTYNRSISAHPEVTKKVTGETEKMTDAEKAESYTFKLTPDSSNPDTEVLPASLTASTTGDATAANGVTAEFGDITYYETGTYWYTIKETAGSIIGMSYDTVMRYVKVVVEADPSDSMKLMATVTYGTSKDACNSGTLTIINTFTQIKGNAEIPVMKQITGNDFAEDEEFEIKLTAEGATKKGTTESIATADMPSIRTETLKLKKSGNDSKGTFQITGYTVPGTYIYTIAETAGTTPGMIYDSAKQLTVEMDYNDAKDTLAVKSMKVDGQTVSENSPAVITNKYGKASYTPEIQKVITGINVPSETYTFKLVDESVNRNGEIISRDGTLTTVTGTGTAAFGEIIYVQEGTYEYLITEIPGTTPGMNYASNGKQKIRITVTVERDDLSGKLTIASVKCIDEDENDSDTITNAYKKPDKPSFEKKIADVNDTDEDPLPADLTKITETQWQDSADYDIGDKVPYRLKATLAGDVSDYSKYTVIFHDKLEKGLTLDADSIGVYLGITELTTGNGVTVTKNPSPADGDSFDVTVSWLAPKTGDGYATLGTALNEAEVYVYFTATLNESAVLGRTGNVNTACLEYSNTPGLDQKGNPREETERTPDDFVIAFTYEVDINKVDPSGAALSGAEFTLEKILKDGSKVSVKSATAANGATFTFKGLDDGDYILTETKAPNNRTAIEPITFSVTAEHEVIWTDLSKRTNVLTSLTGDVLVGKLELGADTELSRLTGDVVNGLIIKVQKTDIATGEELTGAVIQILDQTGAVVDEWTSVAGTPHEVFKLNTGEEYILHEKIAPEGYLLTADTRFWIDEDGNPHSGRMLLTRSRLLGTNNAGTPIRPEDGVLLVEDQMKTTATVHKNWEDENNRDGLRPAGLEIILLANGEPSGKKANLTADNHWTVTLDDLPLTDREGKVIKYTWQEPKVEGYMLSSSKADGGTLTTLTNTHVPAKTEVSVSKVWADNNDLAKKRPVSIEVQLYADEKALGEAVTLSADNSWTYTWKDLNVNTYEDGRSRKIVYTVAETEVPEDYESSTTGNASTGFVITNTYGTGKLIIEKTFDIQKPEEKQEEEEQTTDFEVQKIWVGDNDNADGNRPESITVRLYAGGIEIKEVQLKANNGWKYHFGDLPKYKDGKPIHYSVSEDPVDGYSTEIDGFRIYNRYQPERTHVTVRKIWNDDDNKQKIRPESILMKLSNGMTVILSEENGWMASITDLPAKVNGKPAEYTWTEQTVMGYELESKELEDTVTTFTNKPWTRPEQPSQGRKPKTAGETLYVFDEYDTPLGVEIVINHVGDCFD